MRYFKVEIGGNLGHLSNMRELIQYQKDEDNIRQLLSQDEIEESEIEEFIDDSLVYSYNENTHKIEEL